MQQCTEFGVDGHLLWQYTCGSVDMGSHTQYSREAFDNFVDDSVWKTLKARG